MVLDLDTPGVGVQYYVVIHGRPDDSEECVESKENP